MSNPESWLHKAAQALQSFGCVSDVMKEDNGTDFWRPSLFNYGQVDPTNFIVTGFKEPDSKFIAIMADYIRDRNDKLKRGATKKDVEKQIASVVRELHHELGSQEACAKMFPLIVDKVAQWFEDTAADIVHYVPCILIPDYAAPFSVGPIKFVHKNDIDNKLYSLPNTPLPEVNYNYLFRALCDNSADWVAIVEITKCVKSRSTELACLAIDVAIGALKIIVTKKNNGSGMARATARTLSKWNDSLATYAPQCAIGPSLRAPGCLLTGSELNKLLDDGSSFLSEAGISVAAFLSGNDKLRTLRQAWCDSAYWYNEGTAEPLATVAVIKLETAIEALLRTSSSTGSGELIKSIIKKLTGLNGTDMVPGSIGKTVAQYVKDLVRARSRILHGTLSPLIGDTGEELDHLIWLSRRLLLTFADAIEDFSREDDNEDSMSRFLEWLEKRRAL